MSIGIVCASGFGVARLMMTRLEKYLSDKAFLKAYGRDELTPESVLETDFFVSTMNLDAYGVDYLIVSPLITGSDLASIEHKMMDYSHLRRAAEHEDFLEALDRIAFATQEIRSLLQHFQAYAVAANVSFRELLLFLGLKITGSTARANQIVDAVTEREKLYSQIFPDMGFALLHCRTKAVEEAVFVTCAPKSGGSFTDPYFKEIRSVVMMLSPMDDHRREHADVLGSISAAFVTNPHFLNAVCIGSEPQIRAELTKELKQYYQGVLRRLEE